MTPNPKDPRFIIHCVPADASVNLRFFYDEFLRITQNADTGKWLGVTAENFAFEYSTYDRNAEIIYTYKDKNEHTHRITARLYEDSVSTVCWFSYLFKAENFAPTALYVQSYAEYLMLKLWDLGIDAELCNCDWGLEFSSDVGYIFPNMDKVVSNIITSIKPMEWFYSDEEVWRCYKVYNTLKQFLPKLKEEASKGRWPNVKPENFLLERDKKHAYIALRYSDEHIYNLAFKLGMQDNGFDKDMSGKWFECIYDYTCVSSEPEIEKYFTEEQQQICKIASTILDMISYKMLFFYGDENKHFGIIVKEDWACEKFCQMLDVMLPLFYKHQANEQLITNDMLEQKKKLENLLQTSMEIVENKEPDYIFRHGHYIEKPEDPTIAFGECPF